MNTIAEIIKAHLYINALDVLYDKLELLEEQFNNGLISYIEYSSSKEDIIIDIDALTTN
jgi:hypothetical protein